MSRHTHFIYINLHWKLRMFFFFCFNVTFVKIEVCSDNKYCKYIKWPFCHPWTHPAHRIKRTVNSSLHLTAHWCMVTSSKAAVFKAVTTLHPKTTGILNYQLCLICNETFFNSMVKCLEFRLTVTQGYKPNICIKFNNSSAHVCNECCEIKKKRRLILLYLGPNQVSEKKTSGVGACTFI